MRGASHTMKVSAPCLAGSRDPGDGGGNLIYSNQPRARLSATLALRSRDDAPHPHGCGYGLR